MDYAQLFERIRRNDQSAITALYHLSYGRAYFLAKNFLQDEDEAQDVLQDSYIKAFRNLDTLDRPEKFQAWLDTIVINSCKDILRKKRPTLFSEMAGDDDGDESLDFEDTGEKFSPEATLDYKETKRLIKAMIDRLPEPQRIAVTLYYMEEMSVGQIASYMGCSEGTVKSRLNTARKSLKIQVEDLERKGTKLYCAPFVPFLFWFFRQEISSSVIGLSAGASSAAAMGRGNAAVKGVTSAKNILAGNAMQNASTAGSAAAVKTAGTALGVKIGLIAFAEVACITGGVLTYKNINNHLAEASQTTIESTAVVLEPAVRETEAAIESTTAVQEETPDFTAEEMQTYNALYGLLGSEDKDAITDCFRAHKDSLDVIAGKLQGKLYVYDGSEFKNEGNGVIIKNTAHIEAIVYVGGFSQGLPNGKGFTVKCNSGDEGHIKSYRYAIGQWKNGKLNGQGLSGINLYHEDNWNDDESMILKEGNFKNDILDGETKATTVTRQGNTYIHRYRDSDGIRMIDSRWTKRETNSGEVHYTLKSEYSSDGTNDSLSENDKSKILDKSYCRWIENITTSGSVPAETEKATAQTSVQETKSDRAVLMDAYEKVMKMRHDQWLTDHNGSISWDGYSLFDLDGDGAEELLYQIGSSSADNTLMIYTYKNGRAVKVEDIEWDHGDAMGIDKGGLLVLEAGHMGGMWAEKIKYDGKTLTHADVPELYISFEEDTKAREAEYGIVTLLEPVSRENPNTKAPVPRKDY